MRDRLAREQRDADHRMMEAQIKAYEEFMQDEDDAITLILTTMI